MLWRCVKKHESKKFFKSRWKVGSPVWRMLCPNLGSDSVGISKKTVGGAASKHDECARTDSLKWKTIIYAVLCFYSTKEETFECILEEFSKIQELLNLCSHWVQ